MEPLTHFLTGACLGRSGFNRRTALATLTMTLAAEAPDLDVLSQFGGPAFGFAHHRGFTHSFLGLFLMSALVVGFVYLIWRLGGRKLKDPSLPPRWGLLFVFAYIAGLTHILLDFTNNYGVRPFWPLNEKWFSWDIVFIFEPVMFGFLLLGLIVPSFLGLIDSEVGARQKGPRGRVAAIVALAGVAAMYGLRDFEHRRAISALEARTYQNAEPVRASAYPAPINPFAWAGVVETQGFFVVTEVNSRAPEVDPQDKMEFHYKSEETPATMAAKRSYLGRVYLDWAQYPVTETEQLPGGESIVHFQDLRFAEVPGVTARALGLISRLLGRRRSNQNRSNPLGAGVLLDQNLHVLADVYGRTEVPEPAGN